MLKYSRFGSTIAISFPMKSTISILNTPACTITGVRCPTTKIASELVMLTTIGARVEIATLTAVRTPISKNISTKPGRIKITSDSR